MAGGGLLRLPPGRTMHISQSVWGQWQGSGLRSSPRLNTLKGQGAYSCSETKCDQRLGTLPPLHMGKGCGAALTSLRGHGKHWKGAVAALPMELHVNPPNTTAPRPCIWSPHLGRAQYPNPATRPMALALSI